ncbi:MAG: glycosyltransferase [Lachnospiraceae bacterium]|nr:glycosyltransferase [Lachnospiraceae bacterium]
MQSKKQKILIVSHAMELGGAEMALLGLLEHIDTDRAEVDLFLLRHQGELLPQIPEKIRLLPEEPSYACLAVPIFECIRRGKPGVMLGRIVGKAAARWRIRKLNITSENDLELEYSHKCVLPFVPQISKEKYDLAISFLTPHYFTAEKVHAKRKVAWIHTDYAGVTVDRTSQLRMWSPYDFIASISDRAGENFLKVFPELSGKVITLPNMMPDGYIRRKAGEPLNASEMPVDGRIRLLSIGRFCRAKNFDNVPDICRRLLDNGLNVCWYLIGYGGDEDLIRRKIAEAQVEDSVLILGKKDNPYPYIKNCDLYIQPSRYEGRSVAVTEAQMLGKPVVITRYQTSASQLEDGVDGVIVPMDNAGCAGGIAALLQDGERMQSLIDHTLRRDYTNRECAERILALAGAKPDLDTRGDHEERSHPYTGKKADRRHDFRQGEGSTAFQREDPAGKCKKADKAVNEGTVSVIIPVYKVEKYLSECIGSVINQTFSNLQILLVDDGSPDLCGQICDGYAKKDPRILVIHKENGGLSDARNAGMKKAAGEFIYFLDSDDWIEPDTIERLMEAQRRTDADLVFAGFRYTYPDREDRAADAFDGEHLLTNFEAMQALADGSIQTFAWGKLVRSEIAKRYPFPVGKLFEDHFWTHRVLGDVEKVLHVPGEFVHYRQREDSISYSFDLRRLDVLLGWYCRIRFFEERYPELAPRYKRRVAGDFVNLAWLILTRMKRNRREAFGRMRAFSKKTELAACGEGKDRKIICALERNALLYAAAALLERIKG